LSCDWATSPRFCSHWILIGLSKSGHVSHLSRPFVWRPSSSSARSSLARPRPGARRRRRTSLARTLPPADAHPFFPTPASAAAPHLHLSHTCGGLCSNPMVPRPSALAPPRPCPPLAAPLPAAAAIMLRPPHPRNPGPQRRRTGGLQPRRATPRLAPSSRLLNFNAMEALSKISLSPSACLAAQRKVSARVAHTAAPATAPVPAPFLQG